MNPRHSGSPLGASLAALGPLGAKGVLGASGPYGPVWDQHGAPWTLWEVYRKPKTGSREPKNGVYKGKIRQTKLSDFLGFVGMCYGPYLCENG